MLLIRPLPCDGESIAGYLGRIARANGFISAQALYSRRYGRLMYDMERVPIMHLAQLTGHGDVLVQRLWLEYQRRDGRMYYLYKGREIPSFHAINGIRCCPTCLATDGIWRAKWRIGWLPACDIHGTLLVCPSSPAEINALASVPVRSELIEFQVAVEALLVNDDAAAKETFNERMRRWVTAAYQKKQESDDRLPHRKRYKLPGVLAFPLTPSECLRMYETVLSSEQAILCAA